MKKSTFFLCTTLSLVAFIVKPVQAQLFKKLKEKAQQAIEKKPSKEATNNNQTSEVQKEETQNSSSSPTTKSKAKWQPTPDCEKLLTLNSGETILFDETKVYAKEGKMSYAFITQDKSYKYYLIEDGKRSGPFNEAPINQVAIRVEVGEDENTNSNNDDGKIDMGNNKKDAITLQYSKTINNKLHISFNGKNYGPYDYIAKIKVSPDKKRFWAAVTIGGATEMMAKMGMGNSFLVNENNVKQKVGDQNSFPAKILVSNNFNAAALSVLDNGAQKLFTVSSIGKKQEGNMMDMYGDNGNNMTVADNGDIISIPSQSPTQLLVNGNEAANFKVPITSISRLFILVDYKKSVYYQSGKLYRGDGSEESLKGVTFPKFVTLNNQPCIYYYKLHETDNGEKDVYLCKKCL